MGEKKSDALGCLGLIFAGIIAIAISAIIHGCVLSILWGWFIAPFFGVPALSIAQAIGLGLVVGMFRHKPTSSDDSDGVIGLVADLIVMPLFIIIAGWIVLQFI